MSGASENLVLEHLRAIRADVGSLKEDVRELTHRMGRVEVGIAGLRRDSAHADVAAATHGVRLDRLGEHIERIERRLEIID